MTDNQKLAAGGAFVVACTVLLIKNVRRIHREDREMEKATENAKDFVAQLIAAERVIDNIQAGKYGEGDVDAAMNDFEFENIIARTRIEDV